MKISTNWLKDFVTLSPPPEKVAEALTMAGLGVKKIEPVPEHKDTLFEIEITPNRPDWLSHLGVAREIAAAAGMTLEADLCILNGYDAEGRMGLHQDKDESERSIAAGIPVVSISLGDSARFLFGGTRRRDPVESLRLSSGDAFVFGGPARLRYHGVSRILPGTAPAELGMTGRFNLTFRQYDVEGG